MLCFQEPYLNISECQPIYTNWIFATSKLSSGIYKKGYLCIDYHLEDYQHTFVDVGIYVYKCKPHSNLDMGGAILVGQPVNLHAIKAANVTGSVQNIVTQAINAAENL